MAILAIALRATSRLTCEVVQKCRHGIFVNRHCAGPMTAESIKIKKGSGCCLFLFGARGRN
jgi:hypothetical protein